MFKHDPIITYNHMQEETINQESRYQIQTNKWEKVLFFAEVVLIMIVCASMILLMF